MARKPAALLRRIDDTGLPDRYATRPDVAQSDIERALSVAIDRIDENLDEFYDRFPGPSSENLVYSPSDNMDGWTTSFWTGLCWLAYEATGDRTFRDAAEAQLATFERRLTAGDVKTHDLGFLYTLSAIAGYRLTDLERYRSAALTAADHLVARFWDSPGLIQAWGDPEEPEDSWERGRMIVDSMMNLPLLFWASEETGDPTYASVAETHARTNAQHVVRDDGSTFHTFKCDVESGSPLGGETAQGYDAGSCWSRGQTWAIYGYALAAEYTDEAAYAQLSAKLANYYLSNVEADHVPRWDFDAPDEQNYRDTSAAAIAACGLDELATRLPLADTRARRYENASLAILRSLTENYTTDGNRSNGLLTDGAYDPTEGDYNECCIWGDYFYVEGLVRATQQWSRYW
ncbi:MULTISPECIES: glycoside hydrolase family 88 protein [Haloferax]|uniref:Unsaturated chondroitin disaccharide hydrolase n=1 Tax=Haloferax massiliensis TaxID=1476858 RepID=A0A0D6JUU2_9EURY|nr:MULTISPECIES: glycoside hydrolase family 88 protein [Haloferax]MDS0243256.1 glycoside hydrolase family 88 protein [Haloferax sp. S2CR25]MDS0446377.1 glycoside hydrolase family 88 protein [Haloferax sp. S2CR25-2]CQR52441.1 Unsaturated chondroitin disaccharide hydrolase [Haloferax massiliensis]